MIAAGARVKSEAGDGIMYFCNKLCIYWRTFFSILKNIEINIFQLSITDDGQN